MSDGALKRGVCVAQALREVALLRLMRVPVTALEQDSGLWSALDMGNLVVSQLCPRELTHVTTLAKHQSLANCLENSDQQPPLQNKSSHYNRNCAAANSFTQPPLNWDWTHESTMGGKIFPIET